MVEEVNLKDTSVYRGTWFVQVRHWPQARSVASLGQGCGSTPDCEVVEQANQELRVDNLRDCCP